MECRFIGVADCMRDTGIGDSGYPDRRRTDRVWQAYDRSGTAFLDVDSFVAGGRITVVNPQERTDFHFLASRAEYLYAVGVPCGRSRPVPVLCSPCIQG